MKYAFSSFLIVGFLFIALSCSEDEGSAPQIDLFSATINGASMNNPNQEIPIITTIELVFSSSLDPISFQEAFSISSSAVTIDYEIAYLNAGTKAIVTLSLEYNTSYTVDLGTDIIGANGGKLAQPINFSFKTAEDDVIRSQAPCISGCLETVSLSIDGNTGSFDYYSSFPIYEESASWQDLTTAVIVVHGASRNADDYFSFVTSTLSQENFGDETVLISPFFKNASEAGGDDFYWSGVHWRKGDQSINSTKISSFAVIDEIINQLADKDHFPVLDKIIITGHSSGALFTHAYAGSNISEAIHTAITFEYVVANSQYFYYPDDQRIDEASDQLYTPSTCAGAGIWPLGYHSLPPYLSNTSETTFNLQFTNRSIGYLLGNGNQSDPTFNTTSCQNTILGSSRYQRGENMFRYMELTNVTHSHYKTIVNGIGHDGSAMYKSAEFRTLLKQLLE
jgi:hypothetical protein